MQLETNSRYDMHGWKFEGAYTCLIEYMCVLLVIYCTEVSLREHRFSWKSQNTKAVVNIHNHVPAQAPQVLPHIGRCP